MGSGEAHDTTVQSCGAPARRGQTLLLIVGDGHFGTYAVPDGGELVLGRDPGCSVVLEHERISRRHARVRAGAPLAVDDLGSTNGVRLGGQRLGAGESAPLPPGASFQLGPYSVLVLVADEAATDGPRAALTVDDPTPEGVDPVIERIARSSVSILIQGETGSGKEVLARTLHALSARPGPFVGINCAALSETLLESELFGHERGAFTGALQAKPGLFEVAARGTVFLDEIGDLPLGLQAKLLRALETRQIYRVGSVKPVDLDVRFLAATHRDLPAATAAGRFRQDLYFRVNGITLRVPPLRERRGAIPELARRFLAEAAAAAGRPTPSLDAAALGVLARHSWPGNVRELRTVIERAFLVADAPLLGPRHILLDEGAAPAGDDGGKSTFLAALRRHRGNVSAVARDLGTSRSQVRRLAERHGIDLDRLRDRDA